MLFTFLMVLHIFKPNLLNLLKPTNRPQLTFHSTYIRHALGLQIAEQNQIVHKQNLKQTTL